MSVPTRYQRVGNVGSNPSDYDTDGFPYYLRYNGSNQWMQTEAINFTATDKMSVFAGVRKLSDAAYGTVMETSANSDGNNGSVAIFTPNSAKWDMRLKGNGLVGTSLSETYTAPITNVLTLLANLAGTTFAEKLIPRINGVVDQDTTSGTIGTGSMGNYPLYIGSRAGSSFWFNGRDYGLIGVGRAVTATELANTESWLNDRVLISAASSVSWDATADTYTLSTYNGFGV